MKRRFSKLFNSIVLALVLALAVPWAAFADELVADGDGLVPVVSNTLNLGNVNYGLTKSGNVLLAVQRTGGGASVFRFSTTPTVTAGTPSDSSVSTSVIQTGIDIPNNWTDAGSGTMTNDTATASVTVSAVSATCGAKSATIVYTATGINNQNSNTLIRQATLTVNWTVVNCIVGTTLTVDAASGTYGSSANLSARISPAVQGKSINFTVAGVGVGSAVTNTSGVATLPLGLGTRSPGTYAVGASFAGDATHGASNASSTLTIEKANATVNVAGFIGPYDGNPHGATGSATGVNGEDLSSLLSLGGTFTNAGTHTANWSFAGNINYNSASGSVMISIGQVDADINVDGYSGTYDGNQHGATGSATGVKNEDLSSLLNLGASYINVPGGPANWSFAGDTNYNSASGSVMISIGQVDADINVDGYSGTYDGNQHGATGSATGVNGEDLSSLLSLGGTFTNAGTHTVSWSFAGNGNYKPANGNVIIQIDKANATINVGGYEGGYDGNLHGATGSATGVNGEDLSNLLNLGASYTNVPGGPANWSFAGDINYNSANGSVNIEIAKAAANINVNGYSGTYDGSAHGATGSATGVNGEDLSNLLNLGASYTNVPGGPANWSFAGNINYNSASGSVNIAIAKANASTAISGYSGTYDGSAHGATGSATGVNGEDLSNLLNLGDTYTNVPGGPANWSFAGNINYNSASGSVNIEIAKASQTISFAALGNKMFGDAPFTVSATATSGLPVTFAATGACTISSNVVTMTSKGDCTVTASQTGNGNYDAATSVPQIFTIAGWSFGGFYQPVDMGSVYNTVKNGSTVPLKFEVFAGSTELTSTSAVKSFVQTKITCSGAALEDAIEVTTTGGTSLRYDATAGQFVQNWQTPKIVGACYQVTMTTQDGSSLTAYFKLK